VHSRGITRKKVLGYYGVPAGHAFLALMYLMMYDCEHLLHKSSMKFHQLAAGQLLSGQPVRYGNGRRPWTVHHVQNHTCWVTLLKPARRAALLDQPSNLRPHWLAHTHCLQYPIASHQRVMWTHFRFCFHTGDHCAHYCKLSESTSWLNLFFSTSNLCTLFNTASSAAARIPLCRLMLRLNLVPFWLWHWQSDGLPLG
jgi:hypothetical protein